jgi:hypothetical protein
MVFASCASLAQQARATDSDSLTADECLRTAARESLELSRGECRDSTTLCLGNDQSMTKGIAKPRACGQAMMRTVAVRMSACALSPDIHQ